MGDRVLGQVGSGVNIQVLHDTGVMRCIRSRIIYADQALFVRRALFEQFGGTDRPILKDVVLCERLLAVTTPLLLLLPW